MLRDHTRIILPPCPARHGICLALFERLGVGLDSFTGGGSGVEPGSFQDRCVEDRSGIVQSDLFGTVTGSCWLRFGMAGPLFFVHSGLVLEWC